LFILLPFIIIRVDKWVSLFGIITLFLGLSHLLLINSTDINQFLYLIRILAPYWWLFLSLVHILSPPFGWVIDFFLFIVINFLCCRVSFLLLPLFLFNVLLLLSCSPFGQLSVVLFQFSLDNWLLLFLDTVLLFCLLLRWTPVIGFMLFECLKASSILTFYITSMITKLMILYIDFGVYVDRIIFASCELIFIFGSTLRKVIEEWSFWHDVGWIIWATNGFYRAFYFFLDHLVERFWWVK
jgi:hypothetical protein